MRDSASVKRKSRKVAVFPVDVSWDGEPFLSDTKAEKRKHNDYKIKYQVEGAKAEWNRVS